MAIVLAAWRLADPQKVLYYLSQCFFEQPSDNISSSRFILRVYVETLLPSFKVMEVLRTYAVYFVRDVPSRLFSSTVAKVHFYSYFLNIFLFCLAYRLFWKVSVIRTHVASSKRSILWTMSSQLIKRLYR